MRVFTTIALEDIKLPEKMYKFCPDCRSWVSKLNNHCYKCSKCPSKNGGVYWHCDSCQKCVKESWKHCKKCGRCALFEHPCAYFSDVRKLSGDMNGQKGKNKSFIVLA